MNDEPAIEQLTIRNVGPESRYFRILADSLLAVGAAIAALGVGYGLCGVQKLPGRAMISVVSTLFGFLVSGQGIWLRFMLRDRTWTVNSTGVTLSAPNQLEITLPWHEIERVRFHPTQGFRFISEGRKIDFGYSVPWYRRQQDYKRVLPFVQRHFAIPDRSAPFFVVFRDLCLCSGLMTGMIVGGFSLIEYAISEIQQGRHPWAVVFIKRLFLAVNRDKDVFGMIVQIFLVSVVFGPVLIVVAVLAYRGDRAFWHERVHRELSQSDAGDSIDSEGE